MSNKENPMEYSNQPKRRTQEELSKMTAQEVSEYSGQWTVFTLNFNVVKEHGIDKTKEELLAAKWEDLNGTEQMLQGVMERYPDMSLEEAIDGLQMLP